MAKVQIKSEKLTPFGGILSIMEKFGSVNRAVTQFSLHYRNPKWQSKSTAGSCGFSCRCAVALRMRRSTRPSLPRCNFVVFPICFYFRKVAFRVEAGCDAALYSLVDGTPQSFDTAFIFFQKPQFGADCLACDLGMFWRKCH